MDTRFKKKRRRIMASEEDDLDNAVVSNHRYKRRRISLNKTEKKLKIVPYEAHTDDSKKVSTATRQKKDCDIIFRKIVPSINLSRIDIASSLISNDCARGCIRITEQTNRKEEMKNLEFSSIKRTSVGGFRGFGYETITTNNIVSVLTDSKYFPVPKFKLVNFENNNDVNTRPQILRDVKNVKLNDTTINMLFKGMSSTHLPLKGQENVARPTRKIDEGSKVFINYDEISLSERISYKSRYVANTKLVISLQRVPDANHQKVVKESMETSFKIERNVDDRPTKIQENMEIQKVRSSSGPLRKSVAQLDKIGAVRELRVKNVRNLSVRKIKKDEQTSLSEKGLIKNLPACVASAKSQGALKKTTVKFNEIPEYQPANQSKIWRKNGKNKNLNVSFKAETDVIGSVPVELSSKTKIRTTNENLVTSTPCRYDESVPLVNSDQDTELEFRGFPASVDLSSHNGFCSFVLNSICSCLIRKTKKLMTKTEAAEKTRVANLCKKALENSRLPQKSSQRLASKKMQKDLRAKFVTAAEVKKCLMNSKLLTPCIKLNKLSEGDISSYKITPLREERTPLKPKTKYDYGIDDVNTDDSTDDENEPKKIVPKWAVEVRETLMKFNPHEKMSRMMIKRWMKPPELATTLRHHLFYKHKKKEMTNRN